MGMEMRTPWKSKVHWNMLDGAFVDAHPGHVKMKLSFHRNLRDFLNKEDIIGFEGEVIKTYCKKVKK